MKQHTEVEIAKRIAYIAHHGQRDKMDKPYIEHVVRVVGIARRLSNGDESAVAAAWLHDVIEDTNWTLDDLAFFGISREVLVAVHLLTRFDSDPYLVYVKKIQESGNDIAIKVKLADLEDHLSLRDFPSLVPRYEAARLMLTT